NVRCASVGAGAGSPDDRSEYGRRPHMKLEAPALADAPPDHALCLECGYPLRGLASQACPECGLPFDPADVRTMNLGRPLPRAARWLVRPFGKPTLAVGWVAAVLTWFAGAGLFYPLVAA